jgi:hypothetical protein
VLVQPFPQVVSVPGQGDWQLLLTHACPAPQTVKQAPQLAGSCVVSLQLLPQALWLPGQGWQLLLTQVAVAPQAFPQPPQLAGSMLVSVQVPLHWVTVALPEQAWQPPLRHACPAAHGLPQPPQLFESL